VLALSVCVTGCVISYKSTAAQFVIHVHERLIADIWLPSSRPVPTVSRYLKAFCLTQQLLLRLPVNVNNRNVTFDRTCFFKRRETRDRAHIAFLLKAYPRFRYVVASLLLPARIIELLHVGKNMIRCFFLVKIPLCLLKSAFILTFQ